MSEATDRPADSRKMPLHTKIMIGLIAGIVLGLVANYLGSRLGGPDANKNGVNDVFEQVVYWIEGVGRIFLRIMFMVVVPLVFSALALAIVEIGNVRSLGRMGLRTLFFTGLLSFLAVVIGVTLVNVVRPGDSIPPQKRQDLIARYSGETSQKLDKGGKAKTTRDILIDLLPENPLQEMVGAVDGSSKGNGMLAVMVFSLVCGMAIAANPETCGGFVAWLRGLQAIAMTVIDFAMKLAPYGAGSLVFSITAQLGFEVLALLFWFVLTAISGLALHLFVAYSVVLLLFSRYRPWQFFSRASEAMMMAFGSSSSSATLPTAMRVAEHNLKLPPRVSNFVLTVGATGNQNGTALFEGVVVLFLAQVMGVDLTLGQQIQVVFLSVLAGIGTAGVPGGSLPIIATVLEGIGVPALSLGIILGVDRLLDMCRTTVNVAGDLVVATCVASNDSETPPAPPAAIENAPATV